MNGGLDDDDLEAYFRAIEDRTRARERPRPRPERGVTYDTPKCPTPEKIAYESQDAVTVAILALTTGSHRRVRDLSSYECSCGHWHLTRSRRY